MVPQVVYATAKEWTTSGVTGMKSYGNAHGGKLMGGYQFLFF